MCTDKKTQKQRCAEEALELMQNHGYDPARGVGEHEMTRICHQIAFDYLYFRNRILAVCERVGASDR